MSDAARLCGLAWDRSRIAALERGAKSISIEELVVLPFVLGVACERQVTVSELLDSPDLVALTPQIHGSARDIADILAGETPEDIIVPLRVADAIGRGTWDFDRIAGPPPVPSDPGAHPFTDLPLSPELAGGADEEIDVQVREPIRNLAARTILEAMPVARRALELGLWPSGGTVGDVTRWAWLGGETEELAGRRLGEPPAIIVALSLALWGRTLSAERDHILSEKSVPSAATRDTVRSVRGRITRNLLNQLSGDIRLRELAGENREIEKATGRGAAFVALVARDLWGNSLANERDRLVAESEPDASPDRRRELRERVTRQLVDQVTEEIRRRETGGDGQRQEEAGR
ncbi:hypothetical protein [Frankia gtarii]|uniref:hypothetical protein n=1 Tax=Frankia gtarii TaxID=2950102 RepID=UPI0021BF7642|nr:hypothetical protein [Frankia gtarii]